MTQKRERYEDERWEPFYEDVLKDIGACRETLIKFMASIDALDFSSIKDMSYGLMIGKLLCQIVLMADGYNQADVVIALDYMKNGLAHYRPLAGYTTLYNVYNAELAEIDALRRLATAGQVQAVRAVVQGERKMRDLPRRAELRP